MAAKANFLQGRSPKWPPHQQPPLSILQNPGKAKALGALPAAVALKKSTVRPRDVHFLGSEKTRVAQNCAS